MSSRRKQKKAMRSRVFLNGVEVTFDCQMADDRQGWVLLMKRNEQGKHYVDERHQLARAQVHGRVRIERMDVHA